MRFVPTLCLRNGMILGKSLYDSDGTLLLKQGQTLRPSHIDTIYNMGYCGIYVIDDLSSDIMIESVIDDELRLSALQAVKNIYIRSSKGLDDGALMDSAKSIAEELVDKITESNDILVNMVDLKVFDDYTYYHSVNVAVLSSVIGIAMQLARTDLYNLCLSALLHDIGKVFVRKGIIEKKGRLTSDEFEEVKKHTVYGYNYLKDHIEIPARSLLGSLQHHEKFDGTGYPDGVCGKKISDFGRMIAVADVYDALTSDRPYRKAMLPSEAMEYIMGGAGSLFDPRVVEIFSRKVAAYPLGTCVRLSNGLPGIVIENYSDCCMRPKVRIIDSEPPQIIDLKNDRSSWNITIVAIIDM